VLDRVLEQRLQEKHRHACVKHRGVDVDPDQQLIPKPAALDFEVVVDVREFLPEGHFVSFFVEAATQQRCDDIALRAPCSRAQGCRRRDACASEERKGRLKPRLALDVGRQAKGCWFESTRGATLGHHDHSDAPSETRQKNEAFTSIEAAPESA
jgi:hypothetical protein